MRLVLESPPPARKGHRQRHLLIFLFTHVVYKSPVLVFGGPVYVLFVNLAFCLECSVYYFRGYFCYLVWIFLGPYCLGLNYPGPNCTPWKNGQSGQGRLGPRAQLSTKKMENWARDIWVPGPKCPRPNRPETNYQGVQSAKNRLRSLLDFFQKVKRCKLFVVS